MEHAVPMEAVVAVKALMEKSQSSNLFHGLETEYKQNAFIRNHFGFIVSIMVSAEMHIHVSAPPLIQEPVERVLGRVNVQTAHGTTLHRESCYDVPLLESLQALLSCDTVVEQVYVISSV